MTTGFAQIYNPTALTTANISWTDLNKDDIAQGERGCTYLTAGCEINFTQLASNFGVRALSVFDPNLDRPYQLTYNVGIQHELLRGTSVSAEWFHSDFKNLIVRNNMARAASDYTPVTIYSPTDGSPITYYNISTPAERGSECRQQRSEHEVVQTGPRSTSIAHRAGRGSSADVDRAHITTAAAPPITIRTRCSL